jgi:riboflavin kinase/FMN adenylyltransferase
MPAIRDFSQERISSERVREALRHGHMASAEDLLGRPWEVRGEVLHGDKRGRTIGFPTANIAMGDFIRPKFGIYAAQVMIEGSGKTFGAAVNLGIRPMFELPTPMIEAYLLDFDGDLYGKVLRVGFRDFLRAEQKFLELDELKVQIEKDVERARESLQRS